MPFIALDWICKLPTLLRTGSASYPRSLLGSHERIVPDASLEESGETRFIGMECTDVRLAAHAMYLRRNMALEGT